MYFNGNKKKIDNNGLIFTYIEKIYVDDLIKISKGNESNIDYLGYLNKNKSLKKLEHIIKSHLVNSQIAITNFADDSNEILNSKYIYENIIKKKTSYLLKNVYLSSFFSDDYIKYIIKKYKQIMISFNCKYDNKIYINNNHAYFCINDYTKLRLITHKNIYKDKDKLNNVVVIDIHNEKKKLEDGYLYENNEVCYFNKSIICENNYNNQYECNNTKEMDCNKSGTLKINHNEFNKYENINKENKLKVAYENFFTDLYTYPIDLLCIFNNCDENLIGILRNVLANNKSENAQIHLINLKFYECYYKVGENIYMKDSSKFTYNNFNINKSYDIINNQLDDTNNQINMNNVVNIYKNIFFNSQKQQNNLEEIPICNELRQIPNFDTNYTDNESNLNFYNANYLNKEKNFNDSFIHMRNKDTQHFYELNMEYIEKEFFDKKGISDKNKDEKKSVRNRNNHRNNYDVDIYDLKINTKNGKEYDINDKKFYINYDSSSSNVSLSFIQNIRNTKNSKVKKKEDFFKASTTSDFLKKYMKNSNPEKNNDDDFSRADISEEKEVSKLSEHKRIYENNLTKNICLEKDKNEEQYKLKKINKVLSFLQKNREDYFKVNENILKEEYLYSIMNDFSEGRSKKKIDKKRKKFDEFVNYLIEYIGRIHLDIKVNYKQNSDFLVKKLKNYYQIQKIILNNGLINNCNIYNIFNFLIGELIKKKTENKNKLHYILSIFGQDYNFINYDKYSQEACSQSSIHIFFFYSNDKIYIMILDTVNRLL
ncbi:conserved Plasmodium protein, unknown function [Plasmodium relictum]|uniref:Uncharacterized protein n=1 Tax=Plasmodium relictum TaxID=85471 RepID=A0A1J1H601_PLARL|nr:conserved Plasmodium protein, unknown function [Plasmodium relictum]CRG99987.1 conserved Plasmodium protein, unknown function [Plasmodium relictum]